MFLSVFMYMSVIIKTQSFEIFFFYVIISIHERRSFYKVHCISFDYLLKTPSLDSIHMAKYIIQLFTIYFSKYIVLLFGSI